MSLEASSTIMYRGINGLVFFSRANQGLINIPEPRLNFIGRYPDLAASTNGIICCISMPVMKFTFQLCNPVSKDLVAISNPNRRLNIGLVFDPLNSPSHYMVVCPHTISGFMSSCDETFSQVYGFEVFSSRTGLWRESNAAVRIFNHSYPMKRSVFAGGKLYWRMPVDILWFDHKIDYAGHLRSPVKEKGEMRSHVEIGECRGELSYTTITNTDIEIWIVKAKKEFEFDWVKKYNIRLADILEKSEGLVIRRDEMRPLPFEWEGMVLFLVKAKRNGYIYTYYVKTGELKLFYKPEEMKVVPYFSYRSSLAPLPKLCG
ncbi:hypothetical protein GIB67_017423 [Kingdonia uniflora]|uniref:F-box protein At3g26010-like beta-propeller domain-containing protein n=1 Tax=Kingdonia uniflora TaxID=39325 RepID=A0A7J7M4E5_9MAGN|nr:hypothetical protein GIB67_017423 [Kingdonia uniflora]